MPKDKKLKKLSKEAQKQFISILKEKGKSILLELNKEQEELILKTVIDDWYKVDLPSHQDVCDKVDKYDKQWRMTRERLKGVSEDTPDYRQAMSSVVLEVIHAHMMNVIFSSEDVVNCLPTESNDIEKIPRLNVFLNWSAKNELKIFDRLDRLLHNAGKTGGTPYKMHWKKEYGVITKTRPKLDDLGQPLLDDLGEPILEEYEVPKLLYDGPTLEVFSRKDYIIPENSTLDKRPHHEIHRLRLFKDDIIRREKEGKYYEGVSEKIKETKEESSLKDKEGVEIPLAKGEKTILEAYGPMILKDVDEKEKAKELLTEEEYIFTVCLEDRVLLATRKNKFPLRMRPIGFGRFIPDDEGRFDGIGVMEFMENIQKEYDALHNQTVQSTILSNSPIAFFTPLGNMRNEPQKIEPGWAYPTADPNSVKLFQFSGPNTQIFEMMRIAIYWAERMFSIGDYQLGQTSAEDPRAPAEKARILIESGNVRLNIILKRVNAVLKDIFLRLFLLYSENMPANKFMRITGEEGEFIFKRVELDDFALEGLPDFELTGNVLSSNKNLEAQKATVVYSTLIVNPLFNPQTSPQAFYQLTKWWIDKMNVLGVSKFLPKPNQQTMIHTPEEENALMMQGEEVMPMMNEDHRDHIQKHSSVMNSPNMSEDGRINIGKHIQAHARMMKQVMMGGMGGEETVEAGTPSPFEGAF